MKRKLKSKPLINSQNLEAVNSVHSALINLRRWSEVAVSSGNYTELAKQAFNSALAYFWAREIDHTGVKVDFTKFPKIALFRGFIKTLQCDIREDMLTTILELGCITPEKFRNTILDKFSGNLTTEFLSFIQVDSNCLESRIYQAATKLATLIELEELRGSIAAEKDYLHKKEEIEKDLIKFSDLPGYEMLISPKYLDIFHSLSKLRNRIRWAKHPNIVSCSVLGHLFDVAIFSYLMALEVEPYNEELATRYFFMGIFHDFPETFTGDMPSPIKDALPGLRQATEKFENQAMEENVYSKLSRHMATALRAVMLEDEANAHFKAFLKLADHLSAYVECWRELDAGSHHAYYKNVIQDDYYKRKKLPRSFRKLMTKMRFWYIF